VRSFQGSECDKLLSASLHRYHFKYFLLSPLNTKHNCDNVPRIPDLVCRKKVRLPY